MTIEDDVRRLLDLEALRDLKARYVRGMDFKLWDEWRAVWAEDARIESPDIDLLVVGRESIIETMSTLFPADVLTVHMLHTEELEITGPDTARGIWKVEDHVRWAPDADGHRSGLHGFGQYRDEYVREDGAWRISVLFIERLHVHRF